MIADPDAVQAALDEEGIDVLISTSLKNVYYTTGIWTTPTVTPGDENYEKTGRYTDFAPPKSMGMLVAGEAEPYAIVPPVVTTHIPDEGIDVRDENIYIFGNRSMDPSSLPDDIPADVERVFRLFEETYDDRADALTAALDGVTDENSVVALENQTASAGPTDDATYVEQVLSERVPHAEIVEATRVLQELRETKTDEEIDRLRTAAAITEETMYTAVDEYLEEGITEKEFMVRCKQRIYQEGGFEQIWTDHNCIGFGARSAYPHVVPSEEKVIEPGDLVRFEFGCRYEHYPADLARTFIYREQDEELAERYDVLKAAMDHCRSMLTEHRDAPEIMESTVETVREEARARGVDDLTDFDGEMIGHNIGLDLHDPPLISRRDASIEPGMVMNYELMDAQWGIGGIQLEDTILITEDGAEDLTRCPDELRVVG